MKNLDVVIFISLLVLALVKSESGGASDSKSDSSESGSQERHRGKTRKYHHADRHDNNPAYVIPAQPPTTYFIQHPPYPYGRYTGYQYPPPGMTYLQVGSAGVYPPPYGSYPPPSGSYPPPSFSYTPPSGSHPPPYGLYPPPSDSNQSPYPPASGPYPASSNNAYSPSNGAAPNSGPYSGGYGAPNPPLATQPSGTSTINHSLKVNKEYKEDGHHYQPDGTIDSRHHL